MKAPKNWKVPNRLCHFRSILAVRTGGVGWLADELHPNESDSYVQHPACPPGAGHSGRALRGGPSGAGRHPWRALRGGPSGAGRHPGRALRGGPTRGAPSDGARLAGQTGM